MTVGEQRTYRLTYYTSTQGISIGGQRLHALHAIAGY